MCHWPIEVSASCPGVVLWAASSTAGHVHGTVALPGDVEHSDEKWAEHWSWSCCSGHFSSDTAVTPCSTPSHCPVLEPAHPSPPFTFPSQHSHRLCPSPLVAIPWQSRHTFRVARAGAVSCMEASLQWTGISQNSFSMLGLGRLPKVQGSPKDESAMAGLKYTVLVNFPYLNKCINSSFLLDLCIQGKLPGKSACPKNKGQHDRQQSPEQHHLCP